MRFNPCIRCPHKHDGATSEAAYAHSGISIGVEQARAGHTGDPPQAGPVTDEGKGHARPHTTTRTSQAARLRRRGAAKETERRQLNETVAEIQRRYRELQEAEREERR